MAKKKTFRRYCVIKGCKQDFGLGIGVVGYDEVTYTDERGRGFDNSMFYMAQLEDADKMLKSYCTVLIEPKVKGKKWDKDPQKTHAKTIKRDEEIAAMRP